MSFIARLLRRWGFIRLQDYGLVLTDDNRVIPAADLGHAFEPPSWCSVSVPIEPADQPLPALPPMPVQRGHAQPSPTMQAASPPMPIPGPQPQHQAAPPAQPATAADGAPSEDDEWQWKMALARAKAAAEPPKVDQTVDDMPPIDLDNTDVDTEQQRTVAGEAATSPERPAVKGPGFAPTRRTHTPLQSAPKPARPRPPLPGFAPKVAANVLPLPARGAPKPERPIRARGTRQPPIHKGPPRPPRPPRPQRRTPPPVARTRPSQSRPASDDTRPDVALTDFTDGESTIDRTIPSAPAILEDTQVELRVPSSDKPLPRLSAILDKRSTG